MDFKRKLIIIFLTFFFFFHVSWTLLTQRIWSLYWNAVLLLKCCICRCLRLAKSVFVCVSSTWCSAFVRYIFSLLLFLHCLETLSPQTTGRMAETSRAPRCLYLNRWCHQTTAPGRRTSTGRVRARPVSLHLPGNYWVPYLRLSFGSRQLLYFSFLTQFKGYIVYIC